MFIARTTEKLQYCKRKWRPSEYHLQFGGFELEMKLTRGGNGIGVFVNTYQDGFCAQGLTDFSETFQDTSDNIAWQFETKEVSQSFSIFELERFYENLSISRLSVNSLLEHVLFELTGWNLDWLLRRVHSTRISKNNWARCSIEHILYVFSLSSFRIASEQLFVFRL